MPKNPLTIPGFFSKSRLVIRNNCGHPRKSELAALVVRCRESTQENRGCTRRVCVYAVGEGGPQKEEECFKKETITFIK